MKSTCYQLYMLLRKTKSLKEAMTKFNLRVESCDGEYSICLTEYPMVTGDGPSPEDALECLMGSSHYHFNCFHYDSCTLLEMLRHNPEGFFKHMATYGVTQGVLDVITQHADEYGTTLKAMKGLKAKSTP